MARQADIEAAEKQKADDKSNFKTIAWERSCTDWLCCAIFLVFIASMVGITGYGLSKGDPYKIITPYDSVGNQCGMPGQNKFLKSATNKAAVDLTNYPYRHFIDLSSFITSKGTNKASLYKSVCVKECPAKDVKADCIGNSDSGYACPVVKIGLKPYGTTIFPGTSFCTPDEELAAEFIKAVKS